MVKVLVGTVGKEKEYKRIQIGKGVELCLFADYIYFGNPDNYNRKLLEMRISSVWYNTEST